MFLICAQRSEFNEEKAKAFGDDDLIALIQGMFIAGTDTTASKPV